MFNRFKKWAIRTYKKITGQPTRRQVQHEPLKLLREFPERFRDAALSITGKFEGRGFGQISGNFDKQGISCGILQWNYGQGSLQNKILLPLIDKHGEQFVDKFFPIGIAKTALMTPKQAIKFAKKHMLIGKSLEINWKIAWSEFLLTTEVIEQQKLAANSVASKAWYYCENNNMKTIREFCWFFDIVTQNGSLKGVKKPEQSEVDSTYPGCIRRDADENKGSFIDSNPDNTAKILFVWTCNRVTRNKWASDVIARKGTIAHMSGFVHESFWDLRDILK